MVSTRLSHDCRTFSQVKTEELKHAERRGEAPEPLEQRGEQRSPGQVSLERSPRGEVTPTSREPVATAGSALAAQDLQVQGFVFKDLFHLKIFQAFQWWFRGWYGG